MLSLLRPNDKLKVGVLLVLILVGAGLETVGIGLIFPFLKLLSDPAALHAYAPLQRAYDLVGAASDREFLMLATVVIFGTMVVKNVFLGFSGYYQIHVAQDLRSNMCRHLFRAYMRAPLEFHLGVDNARLSQTILQSTTYVFASVLTSYLQLAAEAFVVVGILLVLVVVTPHIAIGVFAAGAVMMVLFQYGFRRLLVRIGARRNAGNHAILKVLMEAFHAIKDVAVLRRHAEFEQRFRDVDHDLGNANTAVLALNSVPRLAVESIAALCLMVATLVILGHEAMSGDAVTVLGMIGISAVRLMPSLGRIIQATTTIRVGGKAVDEVHAHFTSLGVEVSPLPSLRPFQRTLTLEGVSFSYAGAGRPALSGIDLTIRRGESVAVVGPSGAGKTTLVDVLLGLLQPQAGRIAVDGHALAPDETVGGIGYVPQAISILDDTLRRNVAFGLPDEVIDDERLRRVLHMAQLEEWVAGLPEGLDVMLGERGVRLSGGQRQRVGIARALYADPEILVLDEATAALDVETERRFTEMVDALAGEKTLVIIAHRLSTIKECGRIAYMEGGRILNIGGFAELYRSNSGFANMVRLAELRPDAVLPETVNEEGNDGERG